jgi:hypothetical protein
VVEGLDANDARSEVARGYAVARFRDGGWPWAEGLLEKARGWPTERAVALLLCLPSERRTYEWAERLGADSKHEYWTRFSPYGLDDRGTLGVVVANLLEHGQPAKAVELLGIYLDQSADSDSEGTNDVAVEMAVAALAQVSSPLGVDWSMFPYNVARLLDYLAANSVDRSTVAQLEWKYLPLLEDREHEPRLLHEELTSDPEFFAEIVSWVYRADDDDADVSSVGDDERLRVDLGDRLLRSWRGVPGTSPDGRVDPDELMAWLTTSRRLLAKRGRVRSGDLCIGRALRHAPPDPDGTWPSVPVREAIESISSRDLEHGLELAVYNSRGVTTRRLNDGGTQERQLARRYREYEAVASAKWPRTAAMLQRIAETYEADARREDHEAELREDLGR